MRQHGDPVNQQVRHNINKIAFMALGFMALVVLLSVWFFAAKKPVPSNPHTAPNGQHVHTE